MELIKASLMVAAGMGGSANLQHNPTFTSNGEKNPPAGYDGFDKVTIAVPLTERTFNANGDYYNDSGGGWDIVHVRVPEGYVLPDNVPLPPMPMDIVENLTDMTTNVTVKKDIYYSDPDHGGHSGCEFYYNKTVAGVTTKVRLDGVDISNPSIVVKIYDAYFTMTDPSTGGWEASVVVVWNNGMSPSTYHFSGTNLDLVNFGDPTHTRTITNDKEEQQ